MLPTNNCKSLIKRKNSLKLKHSKVAPLSELADSQNTTTASYVMSKKRPKAIPEATASKPTRSQEFYMDHKKRRYDRLVLEVSQFGLAMLNVLSLCDDEPIEHARKYLKPSSLIRGLIMRKLFPNKEDVETVLSSNERRKAQEFNQLDRAMIVSFVIEVFPRVNRIEISADVDEYLRDALALFAEN